MNERFVFGSAFMLWCALVAWIVAPINWVLALPFVLSQFYFAWYSTIKEAKK